MTTTLHRPRCAMLGILLSILLAMTALVHPSQALAATQGSGRLHTLTFNACDQYLTGKPTCTDNTPHDRAIYVENIMLASDFYPQVGMFQEMCRSTFQESLNLLGTSWYGDFEPTVEGLYTRCGGNGKWGVAYIVESPIVKENALGLPDDAAEKRVVLLRQDDDLHSVSCVYHAPHTSRPRSYAASGEQARWLYERLGS